MNIFAPEMRKPSPSGTARVCIANASDDFGLAGLTPTLAGPAVNSAIGIFLNFSMTPGDRVTFNTKFVVEPPSTVPLPSLHPPVPKAARPKPHDVAQLATSGYLERLGFRYRPASAATMRTRLRTSAHSRGASSDQYASSAASTRPAAYGTTPYPAVPDLVTRDAP